MAAAAVGVVEIDSKGLIEVESRVGVDVVDRAVVTVVVVAAVMAAERVVVIVVIVVVVIVVVIVVVVVVVGEEFVCLVGLLAFFYTQFQMQRLDLVSIHDFALLSVV